MRALIVFSLMVATAASSEEGVADRDASVYHDPTFLGGESYETLPPGEDRPPVDLGGMVRAWISVRPPAGSDVNFLAASVDVSIVGPANEQMRWRELGNAIVYNVSCENARPAEAHPGVRSEVSRFRLARPSPVRGTFHRDLCRVYCGRHTYHYYCEGVLPTEATKACRCDDEPTYLPGCGNEPFLTARLQTERLYTAWVSNETGPVVIRGSEAKNMTVGWHAPRKLLGHVACWTLRGYLPGEEINGTSVILPLLPPPPPPPCPSCAPSVEPPSPPPPRLLNGFRVGIAAACSLSFAAGTVFVGLLLLALSCAQIYCQKRNRGYAPP